MSFYKSYRLVKDSCGYCLEIYLDPNSEEFSSEISTVGKENTFSLDAQVKNLVQNKFSKFAINTVKLIIGSIVVGTLHLLPCVKAHAATTAPATSASYIKLNTTAKVTALRLNMRRGPSRNYSVMHVLWRGNTVRIIGRSSGWYQIRLTDGRVGWANGQYLRINQLTTRRQKVDAVIAYAKSFTGTPYVYGGDSPSDGGFDCSGFTKYVYGRYGYTLNRISKDQALNGRYVPRAYLQRGDLIFYSFEGNGVIGHVGIYLGNGLMLHSPKTGDSVKITNVTTSYWRTRYVTARRIIP